MKLKLTQVQFILLDRYLLASIEAAQEEAFYAGTDGDNDRALQKAYENQRATRKALEIALVAEPVLADMAKSEEAKR